MERIFPDDPSWESFDMLVRQVVGTTAADNAYQMQLGWTAQWLWGTSISRTDLAQQFERDGRGEEAKSMKLAAHERQVVAAELLEELRKMKVRAKP